uniref:Uncharacterized protein n=1 Tax=Chromera velia CCMP2878 TaxID=1169474 RepID=A0A0G4F855_9ALVE|eukprot:Cvel_2923.t1-p1 / transcript=Cvel_2923.t1 / gene=Cvel_2923 / organism=Chromera_velia_CCMP2878 / gene_product=Lysosomal acid phosphatase, putative / transcript_product=Lysosomal acid phosphatase, putative / location=Cvel_scaffold115:89639-98679(-) / protein_length=588 / sequence_SO=supercontig / SO=protein_coding / is_pseudo=false
MWAFSFFISFHILLLPCVALRASAAFQSAVPKRLRLVVEVARHGARTPKLRRVKGLGGRDWGLPSGQLTKVGEWQHWSLGRRQRRLLVDTNLQFLSTHFDPEEVISRSSAFPRTAASAQAHLAGLYPPAASGPLGEWQHKRIDTLSRIGEGELGDDSASAFVFAGPPGFPVAQGPSQNDWLVVPGDADAVMLRQKEDIAGGETWAEAEETFAPVMRDIEETALGGRVRFSLPRAHQPRPSLFKAFLLQDFIDCQTADGRGDEIPPLTPEQAAALRAASDGVFDRLYSRPPFGSALSYRFFSLLSALLTSVVAAPEDAAVRAEVEDEISRDSGLKAWGLLSDSAWSRVRYWRFTGHDSTLVPFLTFLQGGLWPGHPPVASCLRFEVWETAVSPGIQSERKGIFKKEREDSTIVSSKYSALTSTPPPSLPTYPPLLPMHLHLQNLLDPGPSLEARHQQIGMSGQIAGESEEDEGKYEKQRGCGELTCKDSATGRPQGDPEDDDDTQGDLNIIEVVQVAGQFLIPSVTLEAGDTTKRAFRKLGLFPVPRSSKSLEILTAPQMKEGIDLVAQAKREEDEDKENAVDKQALTI